MVGGLLCAVVIWWLGIDCVLRVGFTLVVISVGMVLIGGCGLLVFAYVA